ncbi:hypothetical protein [Chitinimonas sp.]|uniref:hypothetical protein n=1 Tax=Chitinimonas sp. TaxID=1934313 RepID=UPI0035AEBD42
MTVKIHNICNLAGMPALDRNVISINGIELMLRQQDYGDLVSAISEKAGNDFNNALEVFKKYQAKVAATHRAVDKLRSCFYLQEGDYFILKDKSNLDFEQVVDALDGCAKAFGFE